MVELTSLHQQRNAHGGKLTAHRGDVNDRFGRNGNVLFEIGYAVSVRIKDDFAILNNS